MYDKMNRTELQSLCREISEKNVFRGDRRENLEEEIEGENKAKTCPLEPHRKEMEDHIRRNFRRLRTQLPGCNGVCTEYGCPDLIVTRCWLAFKDHIL